MKRREFVRLASVGVIAPEMLRAVEEGRPSGERARLAWPGYEQAFVVDALAGPMQFNIPQGALPLGDEALDHISSSGITAVNLTVNARAGVDGSAFDNTRARIATWARELVANPATLVGVRSVADLRDAKASQKLGLILGFQDAVPIEDDLGRIEEFYELGVRIVQLTYNVVNKIGSGCLAADDGGLSELGVEVVDCLDERRVLIDLSHCGPRTTLDGIRASRRPVSLTHSGCRAVFDHPRSKDDATLRLLAENGGVVGIYLMPFLNPSGPP